MPTLHAEGLSLHYYDRGQGDALLLFHSFPLHAGMWKPQLESLSQELRVVALDARGFGKSRPPPDALTMDLIADDGRTLLEALGIDRAVVGGVSMGGYAALAFWRRHSAHVRALVLADTRATADSEEGREGRHAFAHNALRHGGEWVAEQMAGRLQRLEPIAEVDLLVREMMTGANPKAVAAAQRGMAVREDSTSMLASINVPVLVIVGRQDSLVPVVRARTMAEGLPHSHLVIIPEAGHVSNLEQPQAFNEAVLEFVHRL
jgi:pimeloyl-ACP methyl ester carboxylesterase